MPIFLGNQEIGLASLGSLPISNIKQNILDPSTVAFVAATGITGSAVLAVNNLVTSLKDENLWNTFDAIYPMVGANATAHKYNLKNPQDTDAAFRLNFVGGWTHNSNGAQGNGTDAYADTYYNLTTMATNSDSSISYYSFTDSGNEFMCEVGVLDSTSPSNEVLIQVKFSNGITYFSWTGDGPFVGGQTSQGFFIQNVQTATSVDGWKNGTKIINGGLANNRTLPNRNLYLSAFNDNGTAQRYSNRGCSFASFGNTIASGKEATFSTIVNNFQSQLGRYSY
jgi:hypothetical protein